MMVFRQAIESDISALGDLRWEHELEVDETVTTQSVTGFFDTFSSFVRSGLNNGEWVVWVAENDGVVVANVFVRRIRKVPKPQELFCEIGYVTNVHTKREFRNLGIGGKLMRQIESWAMENRIELLFLWPGEKSKAFYQRLGYCKENEIVEMQLR